MRHSPPLPLNVEGPELSSHETDAANSALRSAMSAHVGVVRTGDGLKTALRHLNHLLDRQIPLLLRNRALTAQFIAAAAFQREESRGAHFRTDFPEPRQAAKKRSYLTLTDINDISARAVADESSSDNVIRAVFAQ